MPIDETDKAKFQHALGLMQNGGPDHSEVHVHEQDGLTLLLGHNRLSIIDLSDDGNQPMRDGKYFFAFNGEIYNYKDLQTTYGYPTVGESDSEVLFNFIKHRPDHEWDQIDGDFAFVLARFNNDHVFDTNTSIQIKAHRDATGVRQLYYYCENGHIIVSSEIKAILAILDSVEVEESALEEFFTLGYVSGQRTLFKDIKKVHPGKIVDLHVSSSSVGYGHMNTFNISPPNMTRMEGDVDELGYENLVKHGLEEAVRKRMQSDVPVSSTLSGGLDSSIVTYLATKHSNDINTYSLAFGTDNELQKAKEVSKLLGTKHASLMINRRTIFEKMEDIIYTAEEPNDKGSLIPTYFLASMIGEKVTLVGEGADEAFAGYNRHHKYNDQEATQLNDYLSENHFLQQTHPYYPYLGHLIDVATDKNWFLYYDYQLELTNFHTPRIDKMMMRRGVEARVPYLDPKLFQAAMNIPYDLKCNPPKNILREAFRGELPDWVLDQDKKALKMDFDSLVKVADVEIFIRDFYVPYVDDRFSINSLYEQLASNDPPRNIGRLIWSIYLFKLWYEVYVIKKPWKYSDSGRS